MKNKATLLFVVLIAFTASAQKVNITSGKLKNLVSHKSFNMEYSYENGLQIGKKTEKDYVAEKIKTKNEKKAGAGDEWNEKWQNNKVEGAFFDKMETLFNKVMAEHGVSASRNNDKATCTAKVQVYYMDPGFNVGVARRPAYVSMKVTFVADGKELVQMDLIKAPGRDAMGYDFDVSYRLSEAFEKSGKTLGKTLAKQVY